MNENDLRDCFAMFAMLRVSVFGGKDVMEASAEQCYNMADAMLKARSAEPEVEEGIVAVKPKRKTK